MAFCFAGFADEAGKTLKEQIEVTRKVGWDAIEVRLVEGRNLCDFTEAEFEAALQSLKDAGIRLAGFGSQIANWARRVNTDFQADVDELKRNIPRMHKAEVKIIRIMSYPNAEEPLPRAEWKQEVFRRISELARIANDGGVILGHENCSGYGGEGPTEAMELFEAVDNDAFRFIFDTGNRPHGGGNLWDFYQGVKDHVIHVHVKATKLVEGKRQACFPDEDEGDTTRRVLQDLKNRGYDGWVSIEPHMAAAVHAGKDVEDSQKAAEIYIEYGHRLMKMVEELP